MTSSVPRRRRRPTQHRSAKRRRVRPKWFLIGLVVMMFCSALVLNGFVRSEIGVDARGAGNRRRRLARPGVDQRRRSRSGPDSGPPAELVDASETGGADLRRRPGPDVDPAGPRGAARSTTCPARSSWSARRLPQHPDLVREIRAQRLGDRHAHLHPPRPARGERRRDRVDREMTETQLALAGATGETSYLVRPPYSSGRTRSTNERYAVLQSLGEQGYVTALVRRRQPRTGSGPASTRSCTSVRPRGRQGGDRAAARRRRRPLADRRGARRADPGAAAEGLHVHHRHRRRRDLPPANLPAEPARRRRSAPGSCWSRWACPTAIVDALEWSLAAGRGRWCCVILLLMLIGGLRRVCHGCAASAQSAGRWGAGGHRAGHR